MGVGTQSGVEGEAEQFAADYPVCGFLFLKHNLKFSLISVPRFPSFEINSFYNSIGEFSGTGVVYM